MAKDTKIDKEAKGTPPRADGRKALLLYLHPDVTLDLKKAALDAAEPAYVVAEKAIKEYLERLKPKAEEPVPGEVAQAGVEK